MTIKNFENVPYQFVLKDEEAGSSLSDFIFWVFYLAETELFPMAGTYSVLYQLAVKISYQSLLYFFGNCVFFSLQNPNLFTLYISELSVSAYFVENI